MNDINKNVLYWTSTLNNIGSLEGALQYYHHVTSWGCMVIVLEGYF